MVPKTNAVRGLESRGVQFESFEYDPEIRSAPGVAEALGVRVHEVFKTLVLEREDTHRSLLVMVPGDAEVEPKTLARSIGARSVRMTSKADAERLTGLQTGGIGALALLGKPFEVYIDRSALALDTIVVNGGRRGLNLRLRTDDLLALTGARPIDVHED